MIVYYVKVSIQGKNNHVRNHFMLLKALQIFDPWQNVYYNTIKYVASKRNLFIAECIATLQWRSMEKDAFWLFKTMASTSKMTHANQPNLDQMVVTHHLRISS